MQPIIDNDCGDGSDEELGMCSSFNCTAATNRFRCKSGHCVYLSSVCNGFNDCADGSDEDYTLNGPCKRQHAECDPSTEFKCASSHTCIPVEYVCDQDMDCGDADESDEIGCYTNRTSSLVPPGDSSSTFDGHLSCEANASTVCEHTCTDRFGGFVCSCRAGFSMLKMNVSVVEELQADSSDSPAHTPATNETTTTAEVVLMRRHTCVDIDECASFDTNHCTQRCENEKGSFRCRCATPNYVDSHGDGNICEATWRDEAVVLIAYGAEIRQVRANLSDYMYSTLIENEASVLAMDVDPLERHVYWIDEPFQLIKRSYIPESKAALGHAQLLDALTKQAPEQQQKQRSDYTALAVDWLAKNLYLADRANKSIGVSRADGRYARTLITQNAHSVNSIAVHPILG